MTETGRQDLDFLDRQPVDGQLLSDRLALGPLAAEEALQYAVEIGGALHKAHQRGMVHGCLAPNYVALTGAGAVVLAPPLHPGADTTPYRAPEQVRGQQPDTRSDVFAFGAILYEMAAGTCAFHGEGQELNQSILDDPAPSLTLRSPIYDAMANVISGCLEKSPGARRQRIQNAVIELRFASKSAGRGSPAPLPPAAADARGENDAPAAPGLTIVKAVKSKTKALEPPRPEQFFFKPGEPLVQVRTTPDPEGWRKLFGAEGRLSLSSFRVRLVVFIGVCLMLVAGAVTGAVAYFRPKGQTPVMRFAVNAPEHTAFPGSPAVSPDGRNLAFSAQGPDGKRTLWLRPLDAIRSTPIAGTEGGTNPFWSPDGTHLAYFASRALKIVRLKDLATETICKVEGMNGGGSWNQEGAILFSRGLDDGLYRVAAKAASTPVPVLKVNPEKNETGYLWPHFLPDGKRFIFFVQTDATETTGVYGGSLDPAEYRLLFASETNAVYSALPDSGQKNGYLLFINGRKLMGQAFNAPRMGLAGEPMTLAEDIGGIRSLSLAPISVANNATLVYQSTGKPTRRLVWFDRNGNEVSESPDAGEWGPPRASADGKRAIAAKLSLTEEAADLWTVDLTGKTTQITATAAHEGSPVFSPDGARIVASVRAKGEGNYDLYMMPAEGGKSDLLVRSSAQKAPTDWSHDGRYIFFNAAAESTKWDVWAVSTADRHAAPILDTVNSERDAVLSPDGKWLAFDSDENGRIEVYVQPFHGINAERRKRWKVSAGGGGTPKWSGDGKELYYITGSGRVMAAPVRAAGDEFEADTPVKLFQTRPIPKTWNLFEPALNGQRFLLNLPLEWANSSQIMVVTNWTQKLKD